MDFTLKGRRIKLILMGNDPNPISPGAEGTIQFVDDMKQIHVQWDNGRGLALIPGVDSYEILPEARNSSSSRNMGFTAEEIKRVNTM